MSDNLRRYRAIKDSLMQLYPGKVPGRLAQHLNVLAALISGIVGSKNPQLPHIAAKVPNGTQPESRGKRFARWLDNAHILEEVYFLPYADVLLRHLALQTLVLVMDGSGVGRGCTALMLHVIDKGRALPLAWQVRQGKKGHFPEDLHIALVEQVQELILLGVSVVLLGDGACDGIRLQHIVQQAGWSYVCRTGRHRTASWQGETFRLDTLGWWIRPGTLVALPEALFTEDAYFSDQKSRGFQMHKSHLSDPERLSRLLIASCLAYIWIVYLGALCMKERWRSMIHRSERCDLSLFQLGLRLLDHFLNEDLSIPVAFHIVIEESKSVR